MVFRTYVCGLVWGRRSSLSEDGVHQGCRGAGATADSTALLSGWGPVDYLFFSCSLDRSPKSNLCLSGNHYHSSFQHHWTGQ